MKVDYSIHYSRFHDTSDAHVRGMVQHVTGILEPLVPLLRSARILDVGCGFGYGLQALRGLGFTELAGLEVSPQQADRCRAAGFNVEVTQDSAEWLRGHPASYDCVVLMDVLEHVPPQQQIQFLESIRIALRPAGRLVLTTPNANSPLASRWRYIDYTHHSSFTEHSLYFVLRSAGFAEIWIGADKGIKRFSWRVWKPGARAAIRRSVVRWCWLQVFKSELPWESLDGVSFELNLTATALRP